MTCFHLFSSHHQGFCFEAHLAKTRAKRLPKSSGETVFASQPAFCTCHRLLLVYCCCIFQVSISRMFQIRDVPKWQMLTSSSNTKVWNIYKHSMTSCVYENTVVPQACHLFLWCSLLMTPWQKVLWTVSGADWSRFMQQVGTIVPVLVESQVKGGRWCQRKSILVGSLWSLFLQKDPRVSLVLSLCVGGIFNLRDVVDFGPLHVFSGHFRADLVSNLIWCIAHYRHVLVQVLAVVLWKPYKDCHLMCYKVTWHWIFDACCFGGVAVASKAFT